MRARGMVKGKEGGGGERVVKDFLQIEYFFS